MIGDHIIENFQSLMNGRKEREGIEYMSCLSDSGKFDFPEMFKDGGYISIENGRSIGDVRVINGEVCAVRKILRKMMYKDIVFWSLFDLVNLIGKLKVRKK